jgi:hypothetical protein
VSDDVTVSDEDDHTSPETTGSWAVRELWVRRGCTVLVAAVAGYASYQHQHEFAVRGGADATSAALWPLSVDGLLVLASVGLLSPDRRPPGRSRWALWAAFLLGIAVSLAANVAVAPAFAWAPVLVAGWPPVSLLLAVELLTGGPHRRASNLAGVRLRAVRTPGEDQDDAVLMGAAERVMWRHFLGERSRGKTPTGADLDRVAGTNNYGRAVLRRWRRGGLLATRDTPVDGCSPDSSTDPVAIEHSAR